MMRIAIVGYGRMGREVEMIAGERGHEICRIVDPAIGPGALNATEVSAAALHGCDVAIEFSLPDAVIGNLRTYMQVPIPAVIGTTGWRDKIDDLASTVDAAGGSVVYGSNFSVGAHVFFRLAAHAGALVRDLEEYDLLIHELHHRNKKDSPSGTALSLAEAVLAEVPRKRRVETARLDRAPDPDELHVSSSRGGSLPGTHTLYLDSPADTIEITHRARTRSGFALGAVRAAEWIIGKRGLFTVDQFITDLLEKR
jgi:4-hydroxy-tetrahydrodipicolinate reductase